MRGRGFTGGVASATRSSRAGIAYLSEDRRDDRQGIAGRVGTASWPASVFPKTSEQGNHNVKKSPRRPSSARANSSERFQSLVLPLGRRSPASKRHGD